MTNVAIRILFIAFLSIAVFSGVAFCQQTAQTAETPKVDAKADRLLRGMSDLLANSKSFSFKTVEAHDRLNRDGIMQTRKGSREVILNRPNKLRMKYVYEGSPQRSLHFWYDGTTTILESPVEKVYARAKMPPTLDEMLDYTGTTLDTPMPMADIFYSSPYDSYMSPETSASYVKLEQIDKQSCHQLAFQSPLIDYRIWVADGKQPVPCQIELIYKTDEGNPKTLMTFSDWNFSPAIAADTFAHEPPADFKKIKIVAKVPIEDPSAQTQTQTQTQTQEKEQ